MDLGGASPLPKDESDVRGHLNGRSGIFLQWRCISEVAREHYWPSVSKGRRWQSAQGQRSHSVITQRFLFMHVSLRPGAHRDPRVAYQSAFGLIRAYSCHKRAHLNRAAEPVWKYQVTCFPCSTQ